MTALPDPVDVHPVPAAKRPGTQASPSPLVPPVVLYAAGGVGLTVAWLATIWVSTHLSTDPLLHRAALFVHLASLVVGFGAVLTLDWFALLWLLGKLPLSRVVETTAHAHLMIWLGLAGLVLSGVMLQPELHQLTCIKLAAVLLITLNGLNAHHLQHGLTRGRYQPQQQAPGPRRAHRCDLPNRMVDRIRHRLLEPRIADRESVTSQDERGPSEESCGSLNCRW